MAIILFCALLQAVPAGNVLDADAYPMVGVLPELLVTAKRAQNAIPDTLNWLPILTVYGKRLTYPGGNITTPENYEKDRQGLALVMRLIGRFAGLFLLGTFAITWTILLLSRINRAIHFRHVRRNPQAIALHALMQRSKAFGADRRKQHIHRFADDRFHKT